MNGYDNFVSFHINGKKFTVHAGDTVNSNPNSLLIDFIRNEAGLTGTKYTCREGGCGACVVVAKSKDPATGKKVTRAINSCLTPVFSCDGLDISTVERLGNQKDGYDVIQNRLVGFSGTQCGFCTPGFVMSMYGLMKNNQQLTVKEIEDNLDGNVCRCTGFRPILDAFKSLAVDVPESIKKKCAEIEESTGKICPMKESCCKAGKCLKSGSGAHPDIEDCCRNSVVNLKSLSGEQWHKPLHLEDALDLVKQFVSVNIPYRLVAGNTSTGIFKNEGPYTAFIDINGIAALRELTVSESKFVIGGGVTLTVAIQQLKVASELNGYEYAAALAKHWLRVANVPVRNAGTIAGNLMIKHAHREFPSDIFLTLEALGAKLSIASVKSSDKTKLYTLEEFLNVNMNGSVIVSIHLPHLPKSTGHTFRSYKITKRYQNAHAYVNSAMVIKIDSNFNVVEKPRLCFGGITPTFVHAVATENYLVGKSLRDKKTLEGALEQLEKELNPDFRPPDASPEYRKCLARNLLYKTVLGIIGASNSVKHASGARDLEHNVTTAKQVYDYKKEEWPLTQPIPKLEAVNQCSGEAEYINDIQPLQGELFGAFVLSSVANAELKNLDPSEALKIPGVVAFISAKDIPGENNYLGLWGAVEPIFIDKVVNAAGQPLGLVLAENRDAAYAGVKKVKVDYANIQKPVLTIKEALAVAEKDGSLEKLFTPPSKGDESKVQPKHTIKGEVELTGQYHFQMEPHVTICVPKEGSLEVYSATQFMDHVQNAITKMLNIPSSSLTIQVRRLGGGYGSKISRSSLIAAASALGAYVTNKPVRIALDLETNMHMIGKRPPYLATYEVGFDDSGKIHKLNTKIISDGGANANEPEVLFSIPYSQNAYDSTGWEVVAGTVRTNTVSNTYCRAPGTTQGIATIEYIFEHLAHYLKKDPLEVRLNNLIKDGGTTLGIPGMAPNGVFNGVNLIPYLVDEMKKNADYEKRKKSVEEFNKANRWVKRGLGIVPMKYNQHFFSLKYPCFIAIYAIDGSVAISHGGIEMGQGINTKVAQTVAHSLGVPLDKVKVKPSNSIIGANATCTGGAVGSELVCYSALQVCKILKDRMAPVKEKLGDDISWEKLLAACNNDGIDLRATYSPGTQANETIKTYDIWGLNLTEVEVDMLTGEFKIARIDLIEDAGKCISPEIDIGQVEGALVMGLGLWTMEKLHYDKETGQLLTNNTWEYKVPFAKDIPEDLRINLLCNAPNPDGVLGSKATGEPPICMSICVLFALKNAIDSARKDAGNEDWYQITTPLTPEHILRLALTTKEQFQL